MGSFFAARIQQGLTPRLDSAKLDVDERIRFLQVCDDRHLELSDVSGVYAGDVFVFLLDSQLCGGADLQDHCLLSCTCGAQRQQRISSEKKVVDHDRIRCILFEQ